MTTSLTKLKFGVCSILGLLKFVPSIQYVWVSTLLFIHIIIMHHDLAKFTYKKKSDAVWIAYDSCGKVWVISPIFLTILSKGCPCIYRHNVT